MRLKTKLGYKEISISRFKGNEHADLSDDDYIVTQYGAELKFFLNKVLVLEETAEKKVRSVSLPVFALLIDYHLQQEILDIKETTEGTRTNDLVFLDFEKVKNRNPLELDTFHEENISEIGTFDSLTPTQCFGALNENPLSKFNFGPFFGPSFTGETIMLKDDTILCSVSESPCTLQKFTEEKKKKEEAVPQENLKTFNPILFKKLQTQVSQIGKNQKNYVEMAYLIPNIYRLIFLKVMEIETRFFDGYLLRISNQFTKSEFFIPNGEFEQVRQLVNDIVSGSINHYYRMIEATWFSKISIFDWKDIERFETELIDMLNVEREKDEAIECKKNEEKEPVNQNLRNISCKKKSVPESNFKKVISIQNKGVNWKVKVMSSSGFGEHKKQASVTFDVRKRYDYDFRTVLIKFIDDIVKKNYQIKVVEEPKVTKSVFIANSNAEEDIMRK